MITTLSRWQIYSLEPFLDASPLRTCNKRFECAQKQENFDKKFSIAQQEKVVKKIRESTPISKSENVEKYLYKCPNIWGGVTVVLNTKARTILIPEDGLDWLADS